MGVRKAVNHLINGRVVIFEYFGHLDELFDSHRMLNDGRQELGRVLFNRFGNLDFPCTGKKLVGTNAAQIGAKRILRKSHAFFGRKHRNGIFFADVVIVAHRLIHDDVVFTRRRFEDLNAQTMKLLGNFRESLFISDGVVGQVVIDFGNRHPTTLTSKTNKRAISIGRSLVLFIFARCRLSRIRHGLKTINVFQVGQVLAIGIIRIKIQINDFALFFVNQSLGFAARLFLFLSGLGFCLLARHALFSLGLCFCSFRRLSRRDLGGILGLIL